MGPLPPLLRRFGPLALKILVTVGLFALIFYNYDLKQVTEKVRQADYTLLLLAVPLLLLGQLPIGTYRWQVILRRLGVESRFPRLLAIQAYGTLFNQALPSSVGGDVVRVGLLKTDGVPLLIATRAVLTDRFFGLFGFMLLVVLLSPRLYEMLITTHQPPHPLQFWSITLVAAAGVVGMVGAALLHRLVAWLPLIGKLFGPLARDFRAIFSDAPTLLKVLVSNLAAHLTLVGSIWLIATAVQGGLAFMDGLVLVPVLLTLMALPISLGGWGLREGLFITVLPYAAVSGDAALTISVLFGVLNALNGLISGLVYLLIGRRNTAPPPPADAYADLPP